MRQWKIDELREWIDVRFDRAGGPGGQHVNKTSTRVSVLFDFQNCPLLSDVERARLSRRCVSRLTRDGRIRVVAGEERSQSANRSAAEHRLLKILSQALYVPPKRRATRPSAGSRRRRLEAKKQRGELKRSRQFRPGQQD